MRITSHFTWKRTLLIGLSLVALATLVISRNGQVRANDLTHNTNAMTTISPLDCVWEETELGWKSTWNGVHHEKQGPQHFDAVWTKERQRPVEAAMEVTITGDSVSIIRKNKVESTSPGTCNYTGTLSANHKSVSGTYSCDFGDKATHQWSATISEGCF